MKGRMFKLLLLAAAAALLLGSALAGAEVAQKKNVRIVVSGDLRPTSLPRSGQAPISVSVGGDITTTDKSPPPTLRTMKIELNRDGHLDTTGIPICQYSAIQPGSSSRALSACRSSLVGKGSFHAEITLADQKPYPTGGQMLMFHGKEGGKDVIFGHIFSSRPFATSFVIPFVIRKGGKGRYGTTLDAKLPASLLNWGNITGIDLNLSRNFKLHGKRHSFLSAGCPAPKGFSSANFPLTRTSFGFSGGLTVTSTLIRRCKAVGR